jgi:hypothetical protein
MRPRGCTARAIIRTYPCISNLLSYPCGRLYSQASHPTTMCMSACVHVYIMCVRVYTRVYQPSQSVCMIYSLWLIVMEIDWVDYVCSWV